MLQDIKNKIIDFSDIASQTGQWKKEGKSIVFTNGCFDLIHEGHITYLAKASELADKFIIGLNSDNSVRMLEKGNLRPIKGEATRALLLAAFQFVDAVVVFDKNTPYDLISSILPDVLVKGGDWEKEQIVGATIVEANGGLVTTIPFVEGCSTTNYVQKIRNGED